MKNLKVNKRIILLGLMLGLILLFLVVKPLVAPTIQKPIRQIVEKGHFAPQKVYFNQKYKFQFSYPPDWQVEEWDIEEAANLRSVTDGTIIYQGRFFNTNNQLEVLIWENKGKTPVRTWLSWYRYADLNQKDLPEKENFVIGGIPALRYLQKSTSRKKPIMYIFFAKEDKIYELTEEREDLKETEGTQSSQLANPVYDKVLDSFQFVQSPPTP